METLIHLYTFSNMMKIINASSEISGMNCREEVEIVLGNKLNLQLATIDKAGYPNIQPVWFVYDTDKEKLHVLTSSSTKKTLNIRNNSKVYFSVDDSNVPYKGVKGRGIASILEDRAIATQIAEKISLKHYGDLNQPRAKALVDRSKQKDALVIEIDPKFFSTWDFGKVKY